MKSLDILKDEHAVIERVLDLFEPAGTWVRKGEPPPAGFEHWAIEFLRHFADHCHHAKEETALFPFLEARGITRDGGPLGVMLREHEQGRTYLQRMQDAADRRDHVGFALVAEEYAQMLRQHVFKENYVLFQMAETCLTEDDDADLVSRFHGIEQGLGSDDIHERFEDEIKRWEETFRVAVKHQ
jgi:hemerythrin-like domain-containing protein